MVDFHQPPPPSPIPTPPPPALNLREMPSTSQSPNSTVPAKCQYPLESSSPAPFPPPMYLHYMDYAPSSSTTSHPPAPRPSNLTTPSPYPHATTNHTGSTAQDMEATTSAETSTGVSSTVDPPPATPGTPGSDDGGTRSRGRTYAFANKHAVTTRPATG